MTFGNCVAVCMIGGSREYHNILVFRVDCFGCGEKYERLASICERICLLRVDFELGSTPLGDASETGFMN